MRNYFLIIFLFAGLILFAQKKSVEEITGDSLFDQGKIKESISYYEKALKKNPRSEGLLRSIGYTWMALNNLEEGEKYYLKALAVNPKCARCYTNLAKIYWAKNLITKAGEFFDKSVLLDNKDGFIYSSRGRFNEYMGLNIKALFDYNKAIELDPTSAELYLARAEFNQHTGYQTLSLGDINKAIELDPASAYAYYLRGNYYIDKKMPNEALADLNKAISIDSVHAKIFVDRGVAYSMLEDKENSIKNYDKAISLDTTIFNSYYNRSVQKYALEDLDGACTDRNKALTIMEKYEPGNSRKQGIKVEIDCFCDTAAPSYLYQRGLSHFLKEKYAEAIPYYTKNLKKFPTNSLTFKFRGDCYLGLDSLQKALEDFKLCLANKSDMENEINASPRYFNSPTEEKQQAINLYLSSAYMSLATVNSKLNHSLEAVENIDKAMEFIDAFPAEFRPGFYNFRGELLVQAMKYSRAEKDFETSIAADTLFARAYVNRAIIKINKSDQLEMQSKSSKSKENPQLFITSWALPQKIKVKKSDPNWLSALADCNKAIRLDPKLGYAYYVRAYIENSMGVGNYCEDYKKARELGEVVEDSYMKYCK